MASFFSRTKSISRRDRSDSSNPGSAAQSPSIPQNNGSNTPTSPAVPPPGNALVNAYRTAFGSKAAASTDKTAGSSSRTTVDDPISMHLLMETAIADSSSYTVMTPEEADALKRQLESLQARIDNTHRSLAMQAQIRDAALSVRKLDDSGAGNQQQQQDGQEAAKKAEELGRELWEMEKEYTRGQKRLLEHTAGVLQMTHKGYSKDMSVASLTTGPSLPDEDFDDFDMNSGLYKPYMGDFEDGIIDIGSFGGSGVGGGGGGGGAGSQKVPPGGGSMSEEQRQMIHGVEAKVERLNGEMRDMMSRLDSRAGPPAQARTLREDPDSVIEVLAEQVTALEQSVAAIREVQARQLHLVNRQLYESITGDSSGAASPTYEAPPQEDDVALQLAYTAKGVGKIKHLMNHMGQTVSTSGAKIEDLDQHDSVLRGLWDLLNAEDPRSSRTSSSLSKAEFSLGAFSTKVQAVHNRVGALEQQKEVLTRQIQQQRELNASSDAVKDERIANMAEELRALPTTQAKLEEMEGEVARLQTELTMSQAELDGAYGTRAQRKAEAAADPALTARAAALEKELSETIADYEQMTKQAIEHERERESLEAALDQQRDRVEALEATLSEERIQALSAGNGPGAGGKTPATPATEGGGRAGASTSVGVLKAEFRKMMKETKAEHAKRLRDEQDERRRLEQQVRQLKKEGLGKPASATGQRLAAGVA